MNELFKMIKTKKRFRYSFFKVFLLISAVMIFAAVVCLGIYSQNYSYHMLLSAKELLLGSFGVFVIDCSVFYILREINIKFSE